MWDKWKHAFAVNEPLPPLTEEVKTMVDRLAREVVRRHLTTPALMFLEMSRPMNYLGAQAMHFFTPMVSALFGGERYEEFARFLERRDALEIIAAQIEKLERLATQRDEASQREQQL
jgi:hypothetical protein